MSIDDLGKMRFEYAWKWFEFHARQRMTMLNFFLIVVGVVFAAYGTLLGVRARSPDAVAFSTIVILLGFGVVAPILFFLFDLRNRTLVHLAEEVLETLEGDLFHWPEKDEDRRQNATEANAAGKYLGILVRQTSESGKDRESRRLFLGRYSYITKHRFLIPVLLFLVIGAFLALNRIECLASQSHGKNADLDVHATVQRIRANVDQLDQDIQQLQRSTSALESAAFPAQVGSVPK